MQNKSKEMVDTWQSKVGYSLYEKMALVYVSVRYCI